MPDSNTSQAKRSLPRSLSSLVNLPFRWLLFSNVTFFLALQGQLLTRTFLAWDLTHQETALAMVNLAAAIPMLFSSMIGGAISDRAERRWLISLGQTVLLVNECFILLMILTDQLAFWHMLVSAFVSGSAFPFIMPARTAMVFDLVGPKLLGNAIALSSAGINLCRVLGPALMGFSLDFFGAASTYMLAIALYGIALLSVIFGVPKSHPKVGEAKALFADITQGFRYIAARRDVLSCLLFGLVPMFLAMPVQNLFVVFSDETWELGERGLGMLMASAGFGGVIGSLWIARRGDNPHRTLTMVVTTLSYAGFLIAFSQSPHFHIALIFLVIANACASASQTLNNTAMQLLVDDSVRGRMSSLMLMSYALTPLGVIPLAFAAQIIGAPMAVTGGCTLLIVVAISFYLFSPTLRNLDQHVEQRLERQLQE